MAEICVDSSEVSEPMKRAARRRRIDLRRFELAGGSDLMASPDETKRRKYEKSDLLSESDSDPSPRYGVTSVVGGGGTWRMPFRDRMHEIVAEEAEILSLSEAPKWKEVMERSFARMDAEAVEGPGTAGSNPNCRCELQIPKFDHVGSTAVVDSDRIVVANCGDSRAVLGRKGSALPISLDHKPDRPDELNRIEAAGGRVIYWDGARVLGVLAMSRAIGDSYLKPFVISEPEVTITERTGDDECLILASDGLWDVVSNETACDVVRMCLKGSNPAGNGEGSDKACSDAAMVLTKLALARQSADNVSVVVVDLRRNL